MGELYTILKVDPELVKALYSLRKRAAVANGYLDQYAVRNVETYGRESAERLALNTNTNMFREADFFATAAARAVALLEEFTARI